MAADNTGAVNGSHTIGIHVQTAAAVMSNIQVEHNNITCAATPANFCLEIGNFITGYPAAQNPTNVRVLNNNCTFSASGTVYGCISLQAVDHAFIEGNMLNGNGGIVGLEFIELVCSSYVAATHNKMFNVGATNAAGVNFDGSHHSSYVDNDIQGIIYSGTSRTTPATCTHFDYNTISNNRIIIPASAVLTRAVVWIQANAAGSDGSKELVTNNIIYGNNQATIDGITVETDAGTIDSTLVSSNTIFNVIHGITRGTTNGTFTNFAMLGNLMGAGVLEESGFDSAPYLTTVFRANPGFPTVLPSTVAITSSFGTNTNSNTDMAGFVTLNGSGVFVLTWPSGHTYGTGPGCTVSTYSGSGDYYTVAANTTTLTITAHNGVTASGGVVQYHCDFHVY